MPSLMQSSCQAPSLCVKPWHVPEEVSRKKLKARNSNQGYSKTLFKFDYQFWHMTQTITLII